MHSCFLCAQKWMRQTVWQRWTICLCPVGPVMCQECRLIYGLAAEEICPRIVWEGSCWFSLVVLRQSEYEGVKPLRWLELQLPASSAASARSCEGESFRGNSGILKSLPWFGRMNHWLKEISFFFFFKKDQTFPGKRPHCAKFILAFIFLTVTVCGCILSQWVSYYFFIIYFL